MTRKPKLLEAGHTDEIYTPAYALKPLLPFIPPSVKVVWETAWGQGHLAKHLSDAGYSVAGGPGEDFFLPFDSHQEAEMTITNPPYSIKDKWIKRTYEIGLPFALLLPVAAIGGKRRTRLYTKYGMQLIVPDCRVNFITPNGGTSSWFHVAWFTHGLNLAKDLNFVEMKRE